jgi:hypothetical protein
MEKYYEQDWFLDKEHSLEEVENYKKEIVERSVDVFKWVLTVVPNNTSLGWRDIKSFLKDIDNGTPPDEKQFERLLNICKSVMDTSSGQMSSRPFNEVRDIQMDARTVRRESMKAEKREENKFKM